MTNETALETSGAGEQPHVTLADVHAQADVASNEEVQTAIDPRTAQGNAVEQALANLGGRMLAIEQALGLIAPEVNAAAAAVGIFVPAAAPVLDRLSTLETALEGVLTAAGNAFGGKAAFPPPGSATATPPTTSAT